MGRWYEKSPGPTLVQFRHRLVTVLVSSSKLSEEGNSNKSTADEGSSQKLRACCIKKVNQTREMLQQTNSIKLVNSKLDGKPSAISSESTSCCSCPVNAQLFLDLRGLQMTYVSFWTILTSQLATEAVIRHGYILSLQSLEISSAADRTEHPPLV